MEDWHGDLGSSCLGQKTHSLKRGAPAPHWGCFRAGRHLPVRTGTALWPRRTRPGEGDVESDRGPALSGPRDDCPWRRHWSSVTLTTVPKAKKADSPPVYGRAQLPLLVGALAAPPHLHLGRASQEWALAAILPSLVPWRWRAGKFSPDHLYLTGIAQCVSPLSFEAAAGDTRLAPGRCLVDSKPSRPASSRRQGPGSLLQPEIFGQWPCLRAASWSEGSRWPQQQ